jgi:hypothetical protein
VNGYEELEHRSELTKSDVLKRGWTEAILARFMPDPDRLAPNPRFKCSAPMRLYSTVRIERIERSEEFRVEVQKSITRRSAAAKAANTKRERTLQWVDDLPLGALPVFSMEELIRLACAHHQNLNANRSVRRDAEGEIITSQEVTPNSPLWLVERIAVNYLRHVHTPYDKYCDALQKRSGRSEAYLQLRRKVLDEIKRAYPELAEECDNQMSSGESREWFKKSMEDL